jgi:hypothetical protein
VSLPACDTSSACRKAFAGVCEVEEPYHISFFDGAKINDEAVKVKAQFRSGDLEFCFAL